LSLDPNYKATLVILNDIESHGLVRFNKEYHDGEFFENFMQFKRAFSHSISEIVSKMDSFQTRQEETVIFAIYSELSFINSHLEVIKKFLKTIINPSKIKDGFDENTTLEEMLKRICNKMQYPEKLKNSIRGLFLVDFRHAIAHQRFLIQKNGHVVIYPNDEGKKQILNIKDLADGVLQVTKILDAMVDWSNGTVRKQDKKSSVLDEVVGDLTKQVKELDKRLDRLA
jgi:hypothetical protein